MIEESNILLIDSALEKSRAVLFSKDLIQSSSDDSGIDLINLLKDLDSKGLDIKKLDKILVNVGPGSYTGIRKSIAMAKAIALSIEKNIIPITSFELSLPISENVKGTIILSLIETGREDFYYQIFDDSFKAFCDANYDISEKIISRLPVNSKIILTGNGVKRFINFSDLIKKSGLDFEIYENSQEIDFDFIKKLIINKKEKGLNEIKPMYIKPTTFKTQN